MRNKKEEFDQHSEAILFRTLRKSLPGYSNLDINLSRSGIILFVWLIVCSLWVYYTMQNGAVYLDKVLTCSLIITCLLFFKAVDDVKSDKN